MQKWIELETLKLIDYNLKNTQQSQSHIRNALEKV